MKINLKGKIKYKELIKKIQEVQEKLKAKKLKEEQKIKIYFYIKKQEIMNYNEKELIKAKKKYEKMLRTINNTIKYLEENKKKEAKLEKITKKECEQLIKTIDKQLNKKTKTK